MRARGCDERIRVLAHMTMLPLLQQSLKRNTMDRENTFFSSTPLLPPFVSSCNRTVDLDHRYHITYVERSTSRRPVSLYALYALYALRGEADTAPLSAVLTR